VVTVPGGGLFESFFKVGEAIDEEVLRRGANISDTGVTVPGPPKRKGGGLRRGGALSNPEIAEF